ncbi:histidine triad (HIT) family protein [Catalinimonas alkaloidigena]|uniref:HIT family protein n=1 Tax=Catalinimonas alkaloidigena TaxID=1075417 RepID=UPI00240638D9|nr:HIT family protein [Catalinimonas alkaloidigena]MDF9795171.1 histidine triad (HIT) family protein [Catalinimonas alkaloidigena]
MASIFTKIINREIPAYIVAENDHALAFLDIRPLTKGHTLVIPKQEVDYLFDLDDDSYTQLQLFAKEVALKIDKVIPCERISTAVIGLEVPHAHIHLIPINSMSDANFGNPKLQLADEEMEQIAEKIRSAT